MAADVEGPGQSPRDLIEQLLAGPVVIPQEARRVVLRYHSRNALGQQR